MSVRTALAYAHSQVGTCENPAGSNDVIYWDAYDTEYHVHDQGLSWCGAFSWCVLREGGWTPPALWIGVQAIEDWGRTHGRYHDGHIGVQPGDQLILIGHGVHTGVCRGLPTASGVPSVEGNTSPSPTSPDQDYNGGTVAEKVRPFGDVIGYVRVHDLLPPDPAPVTEDEDMTYLVKDMHGNWHTSDCGTWYHHIAHASDLTTLGKKLEKIPEPLSDDFFAGLRKV